MSELELHPFLAVLKTLTDNNQISRTFLGRDVARLALTCRFLNNLLKLCIYPCLTTLQIEFATKIYHIARRITTVFHENVLSELSQKEKATFLPGSVAMAWYTALLFKSNGANVILGRRVVDNDYWMSERAKFQRFFNETFGDDMASVEIPQSHLLHGPNGPEDIWTTFPASTQIERAVYIGAIQNDVLGFAYPRSDCAWIRIKTPQQIDGLIGIYNTYTIHWIASNLDGIGIRVPELWSKWLDCEGTLLVLHLSNFSNFTGSARWSTPPRRVLVWIPFWPEEDNDPRYGSTVDSILKKLRFSVADGADVFVVTSQSPWTNIGRMRYGALGRRHQDSELPDLPATKPVVFESENGHRCEATYCTFKYEYHPPPEKATPSEIRAPYCPAIEQLFLCGDYIAKFSDDSASLSLILAVLQNPNRSSPTCYMYKIGFGIPKPHWRPVPRPVPSPNPDAVTVFLLEFHTKAGIEWRDRTTKTAPSPTFGWRLDRSGSYEVCGKQPPARDISPKRPRRSPRLN